MSKPPRLPVVTDFPTSLNPQFHPTPLPPPTTKISNIMLFLPGLGDTSTNFAAFPAALNLPDTLSITLQPPFPFPFGLSDKPAYHWSDDLSISSDGDLDGTESGFTRAADLLVHDVLHTLTRECGWVTEAVHLFGFGQGGSLALEVALHAELAGVVLGGVVSVGGPLALGAPAGAVGGRKCATPVLVVGGARGVVFGGGESRVKRVRERFEGVEVERWRRGDDGMPRNREEVLPLMRFWGRRLRSRRGVPDGAVEVG